MDDLKIGGQSIKFFNRKSKSRDNLPDVRLSLNKKVFELPKKKTLNLSVGAEVLESDAEPKQQEIKVLRKSSAGNIIESEPLNITTERRLSKKIKKPALFKNYYSDRQILPVKCFSFPRLGENFPFRGRQTLCKYYNNEILNDKLLKIKSAESVKDLEELLEYYNDSRRGRAQSAGIQGEYYDCKTILRKTSKQNSQPCLCQQLDNGYTYTNQSIPLTEPTTKLNANAIINVNNTVAKKKTDENSIDDFIELASHCYNNYIQCHLNQLDWCNQRATFVREQQKEYKIKFPIKKRIPSARSRVSLAVNNYNDLLITSKIHTLDIKSAASDSILLRNRRQSLTKSEISCKIMNDIDGLSDQSAHNQLIICGKEPPKITLSDHSDSDQNSDTNNNNKNNINSDKSDTNNFSDSKNYLTVPVTNCYSSEARPP